MSGTQGHQWEPKAPEASGDYDVVASILQSPGDIGSSGSKGRIALIIAAEHDHRDAASALLDRGPGMTIAAPRPGPALCRAALRGHRSVHGGRNTPTMASRLKALTNALRRGPPSLRHISNIPYVKLPLGTPLRKPYPTTTLPCPH